MAEILQTQFPEVSPPEGGMGEKGKEATTPPASPLLRRKPSMSASVVHEHHVVIPSDGGTRDAHRRDSQQHARAQRSMSSSSMTLSVGSATSASQCTLPPCAQNARTMAPMTDASSASAVMGEVEESAQARHGSCMDSASVRETTQHQPQTASTTTLGSKGSKRTPSVWGNAVIAHHTSNASTHASIANPTPSQGSTDTAGVYREVLHVHRFACA